MGREVKRVALDFNWPVGKTWEGFLMPDELRAGQCPDCELGYGPEAQNMYKQWYGYVPFKPEDNGSTPVVPDEALLADIRRKLAFDLSGDAPGATRRFYDNMFRTTGEATVLREAERMCDLYNVRLSCHLNQEDVDALVADGRLMSLTHTWTKGPGWVKKDPEYHPTAAEVNRWALNGMGHDSTNCHSVLKSRCERLGVSHVCKTCNGEAEAYRDEAHKKAHDEWTETEPPAGEGWQMWETTSEGSPISPVFATPEKLARWLAQTNASAFGDQGASYEAWLKTIVDGGYAVGSVLIGGKMISGVEANLID
jgi:hypothetical protein